MLHKSDPLLSKGTARRWMTRFAHDENGTITIFALMMFVLMLAAGGIAVDVMRYETQRTQLQYTLDRAVLAAAALNQMEDPETVVLDYFASSGLENYRLDVNVEDGLNYRRVTASVEMDIRTFFMNMFGVRALTSPARGAAEERIMDIEISMVLDISGSMGWNGKIANMRSAANDFVDTMLLLNTVEEQQVTISVIPYNGRVNAGSVIESVFTLSDEQTESSCTRFAPGDYNSTAIDPTVAIQRLAHFDRRNYNRNRNFRTPQICMAASTA
jgi:Flp pilus assembly protein TadG